MKNCYFVRSRISEAKFREIVRYFSVDFTALQAAELSGVNRNTINRIYRGLLKRITHGPTAGLYRSGYRLHGEGRRCPRDTVFLAASGLKRLR